MIAAATVDQPELELAVRAPSRGDIAYLKATWAEDYKLSPESARQSWFFHKRHVVPTLHAVIDRPSTALLAAYRDGIIVGWLAFTRGRSVPAVHWAHTRYRLPEGGERLRRRGVMRRLLDDADIGPRFVYTFRGPYLRGPGRLTSDARVATELGMQGVFATFMRYDEWSRP